MQTLKYNWKTSEDRVPFCFEFFSRFRGANGQQTANLIDFVYVENSAFVDADAGQKFQNLQLSRQSTLSSQEIS